MELTQSARRFKRIICTKRAILCCSFLAILPVVVLILMKHQCLEKSYWRGATIFKMASRNRLDGEFDVFETRHFFGIQPNGQPGTWEEQQAARKKLVSDTCHSVQTEAKTAYPKLMYKLSKAHEHHYLKFLLVIDSLKLVYCYVPKAGTTSWKRLLLLLEGRINATEKVGQKETHHLITSFIRNLNSYSLESAQDILARYKKFVFVRNPFERILSAYQDKFQNDYPASKVFRSRWSELIIRHAGGKETEKLLATQRRDDGTLNVTFPQFARYVTAPAGSEASKKRNEHWMEAYRLCHPCAVQYDWIGDYDSLQADADMVLRSAGVDPAVRFPNFTTNPTGSSNFSTLRRYFSSLAPEEIMAVYRQYYLDFMMFGYNIPASIQSLLDIAR